VAIRALLAASPDDHQVLGQGMALFEGLYATTPKKGYARSDVTLDTGCIKSYISAYQPNRRVATRRFA